MRKFLCVWSLFLAQLQELKAMDKYSFLGGIKNFLRENFCTSSLPQKRLGWEYDCERFKKAKGLVQDRVKGDPHYFDQINDFLNLPEDDKAKTWILRMLRNRLPEYYESLEDVLRIYQSFLFFLEIPSQDVGAAENYLYFMYYSDFKDYKKIFKDENQKAQERYNYQVSFVKFLCDKDYFRDLDSMINTARLKWPDKILTGTRIEFWKTFLALEKKGEEEKEKARILSKKLIAKLPKSKADQLFDFFPEEIMEVQENTITQEAQRAKKSWQESHQRLFGQPFFSKLKEREYLWTDFQKSSQPFLALKDKISKPYLPCQKELLDLFNVSCKIEESKKYLELWSELNDQLEILILKMDFEKEEVGYPKVEAFLKSLLQEN